MPCVTHIWRSQSEKRAYQGEGIKCPIPSHAHIHAIYISNELRCSLFGLNPRVPHNKNEIISLSLSIDQGDSKLVNINRKGLVVEKSEWK